MKGLITNIQRFSVHDGYGIRTIVFLSGCSLKCAWCQNPETLRCKPELMFLEELCVGCGACIDVCPTGASIMKDGRVTVNRDLCKACFECVKACYFDVRRPSSKVMTVDETFREFMRDEVFFRNSGGGLTLSGGDPLYQIDFAVELLKRVKAAGLHTAIETAGNVPYVSIQKVLPYTDLFLYDIKMIDEDKHKQWTNVSNKIILSNLKQLAKEGKEIIIRVPLIPNLNDGDEFKSIVDFVSVLPEIREIHILPYHSFGESKYTQLDMMNTMIGYQEENDEAIQACKNYAVDKGFKVSIGGAGF